MWNRTDVEARDYGDRTFADVVGGDIATLVTGLSRG
jgi:hypothetical protein